VNALGVAPQQGRKGIHRNNTNAVSKFIGIIIVVPVYVSHAEKTARQASRNNLLQWGIALNLYLIENRNELPHPGSDAPSNEEERAWYNSLPLYLSQPALTELESNPNALKQLWTNPAAPEQPLVQNGQYFFYYGMNLWLQPKGEEPLRIYDIEDPTATVFMTEVYSPFPHSLPDRVDYRFGEKPSSGEAFAHVLFCDGHVEPVKKAKLSNNPAAYDPKGAISLPTWVPYYNAPNPAP